MESEGEERGDGMGEEGKGRSLRGARGQGRDAVGSPLGQEGCPIVCFELPLFCHGGKEGRSAGSSLQGWGVWGTAGGGLVKGGVGGVWTGGRRRRED